MDWPGKQSVRGMKVKVDGFWKDPRTLAILLRVKQGSLTEEQATRVLRTLPAMPGHKPSDVRWYVRHYDRNGWPAQG